MLDELGALREPRLAAIAVEAKRLLPHVETGYEAAKKHRDQKLALAQSHVVAFQLEHASQILAQVPAPLHNKEFTSALQSIEAQLEVKARLVQEIGKRVQTKEYADLLPLVEQIIALDPNAEYYAKLQTFLKEYERRATKERLRVFITTRVQAKEYAGLLPEVERMIAFEPHAAYYRQLLPFLQEFERQSARAAQDRAALEAERKNRAQLVNFGIISLGLNLLGFLPPVSLSALALGLFAAYKAHLRLTGTGDAAAPLSELDRAAAEKARLLGVLGAGLGLCWLAGFCAICFFRIVLRK
jgi:hypothetical protein